MCPIVKTNADLERTICKLAIEDYFKSAIVTVMYENLLVDGHFADEASSQEWKDKTKFWNQPGHLLKAVVLTFSKNVLQGGSTAKKHYVMSDRHLTKHLRIWVNYLILCITVSHINIFETSMLGRYMIRSFFNRRTVYQSGSGLFGRYLQRYFWCVTMQFFEDWQKRQNMLIHFVTLVEKMAKNFIWAACTLFSRDVTWSGDFWKIMLSYNVARPIAFDQAHQEVQVISLTLCKASNNASDQLLIVRKYLSG